MILKSAHIKQYKSVTDSGLVDFDASVTCLVGKNESGKTAVLEALYRLNPLSTGHHEKFDGLRDYPRRIYNRDKNQIGSIVPIHTVFELDQNDKSTISDNFGDEVLTSNVIQISKGYDNNSGWTIQFNQPKLIEHVVTNYGLDHSFIAGDNTLSEFIDRLKNLDNPPDAVTAFLAKYPSANTEQEIRTTLLQLLPKFMYFNDYSVMPGRVSISKLQKTDPNHLPPNERTALSLMRLAGVEAADFNTSDYEDRKASLEAAANQLTDEVFEYWSQNNELSVELDLDFKSAGNDQLGQPPFLDIRIKNHRHRVTLNFGERSQGFVWFFSFLAAFSEFREKERTILLLDEPGLGLHAAAQADLLRFIDERLARNHQVIYSTHSPFMVESKRLHRVRSVEDVGREGTKVSADVLATSRDTRFPLQAALGYDLAQTLFIGSNNLIVEGPADYLYMQIMSEHLRSLGRDGLDPQWVIVPVGGLDKIPTFVALLGSQLNIAVVLEVSAGGTQKINSLVQRGIIAGEKLIPLNKFTGSAEADIEDMFGNEFYLNLLNLSGAATVSPGQLKGKGRIVKRIEAAINSSFDHYRPSRYLLEHQVELLKAIDPETLNRFEGLFVSANGLLISGT